MSDRPIVTVRCRKRGHLLAELLATPDGLHIHVPHLAVGHAKGSRIVNRRGGAMVVPLRDDDGEPSTVCPAMCADGVHSVYARDLARAADTHVRTITLDPVLR